jgi:hypothetical protein
VNITGVKHNSKGELISYKLDNGSVISKNEGIALAKQGKIEGVTVGVSKSGEEYLRSMPDDRESNNLDNLSEIRES